MWFPFASLWFGVPKYICTACFSRNAIEGYRSKLPKVIMLERENEEAIFVPSVLFVAHVTWTFWTLLLYTSTAFTNKFAVFLLEYVTLFVIVDSPSDTAGFVPVSYSRGGDCDQLCVLLLCSTLAYNLSELRYTHLHKGGFSRYITLANLSDILANGILLYGFMSRVKAQGTTTTDEDDDDYAPESTTFALGLGCAWLRVLLNMMGEWEASAILTQIIKTSILEDVTNFLVVLVCAMIACGVSLRASWFILHRAHRSVARSGASRGWPGR